MRFKSEEERFNKLLSKVEKTPNGCWNWMAGCDKNGYGRTRINYKSTRMNRYFYERFKGPIPDGLQSLHKCNNPKCVNPDHLYAGTKQDNIKDMIIAGSIRGEKNPRAIITEQMVRNIKKDYIPSGSRFYGFGPAKIAKKYGISIRIVQKIVYGETWKHI